MRRIWLPAVLIILFVVYLLGPSPAKPKYSKDLPAVPGGARELQAYIDAGESLHKLKPDNQARIVWANDSTKQKTAYAIVYLHGFSASQAEADPVHRNIAKEFGCNLYLSRLAEHGIDTSEQLINLTADEYWESAKQALVIGHQLGEKLIVMGTSTGATLALMLASQFPDKVDAIVMLSPNIAINDPNAWILNNHWGLQIARMVKRGNYIISDDNREIYKKYWNRPYRLEAAVALEEMLETGIGKEVYEKIKQPALLLYYYKDAIHQDSVVKVDAMLSMFDELGTEPSKKISKAIPGAGNHVLGSYIKSHDISSVQDAIAAFLEKQLGLQPIH